MTSRGCLLFTGVTTWNFVATSTMLSMVNLPPHDILGPEQVDRHVVVEVLGAGKLRRPARVGQCELLADVALQELGGLYGVLPCPSNAQCPDEL